MFLKHDLAGNIKIGLLYILMAFGLIACNQEELPRTESRVSLSTPDSFLTFFNQNRKIPSGTYTIVVATSASNQTGNFSLTLTTEQNSSQQLLTGSFTNSFGTSVTPASTCTGDPSNVCFPVDIQAAGGIQLSVTSNLDTVVYLVDDSSTPVIVAESDQGGIGEAETLEFNSSDVDQVEYAQAYYSAVDPGGARDTLQKYKTLHGFDSNNDVVHVTFRDSKDLGYGRDMYMRTYENTECGGWVIAFFVQNFSLDIVDGLAYGPVNLQAAIGQDLQHHFGSNAIEFSRGLTSAGDTCSPEPMNRFFTYRSDYSAPNADHPRLLAIDLDKRGAKAMPQPCISCHGGQVKLLDRFGRVVAQLANDAEEQIGDSKARLQAFEVDTFEFTESGVHAETPAQENLRIMNNAIYCSYPGSDTPAGVCDDFGFGRSAQADNGEWNGDFAREVLLGWYSDNLHTPGTTFDGSYVPTGWTPNAISGIPEGADTLFRKVIKPNCLVCHGKQGSSLGSDNNASGDGKDIDFGSYQKFISYADDIRRLVFDEGRMPLGLLNYDNFWRDTEKAELLATFLASELPGFADDYFDSNGNVIPPGRIVARAGVDRVTQPNAPIRLYAYASLFADGFQWQVITQPTGASSSFSDSDQGATDFTADVDGSYQVQLTASSSETGLSDTDTLTIFVDSTLAKAPRELTFYDDIASRLSSCAATCHSVGGGGTPAADGVPVWWVTDANQPIPIPLSPTDPASLGLYEQFRSRVNFDNPEISPVLTKPSGQHHYGALRGGFDTTATLGSVGRADYDRFVNWIYEGAVCGTTDDRCPDVQ